MRACSIPNAHMTTFKIPNAHMTTFKIPTALMTTFKIPTAPMTTFKIPTAPMTTFKIPNAHTWVSHCQCSSSPSKYLSRSPPPTVRMQPSLLCHACHPVRTQGHPPCFVTSATPACTPTPLRKSARPPHPPTRPHPFLCRHIHDLPIPPSFLCCRTCHNSPHPHIPSYITTPATPARTPTPLSMSSHPPHLLHPPACPTHHQTSSKAQ
eukprot:363758-Chlamydomonas_euryale.AAC.6